MYNGPFNELPTGQTNANLPDEFMMRVGIPHNGGRLAVHAVKEGFPAMVSAAAFWDRKKREFRMPEITPLIDIDFALDSAGFTAIQQFQRHGKQQGMAGIFPWSYEAYLEFANISGCNWYSQADLCCEEGVADDAEAVNYRIRATATLLEGMLQILYEWQNELARSCNSTVVARMLQPPVPVLQGRNIADYMLSLELLNEVWSRWEGWLAPPTLIGIGSMCRRDLHDDDEGLFAILETLGRNFPHGSKAHCFGVKNAALNKLAEMDFVISSDSMAWDFNSRVKAHKLGVSNSIERRSKEMTDWMRSAMARVAPVSHLANT